MANTEIAQYLSGLALEIARMFVDTIQKVINDSELSEETVRAIIIGQGNHRVAATR